MEEQNNDPVPKPREPPSFPSRVGPLAAELLSSSKLPQPPEDVMAHVVSILKVSMRNSMYTYVHIGRLSH